MTCLSLAGGRQSWCCRPSHDHTPARKWMMGVLRSLRSMWCFPSSGGRRRLMAMLEKSEIQFLPLGARRVAYEIRGDGPPLVAPAWWVSHLELDWQDAGFRRFWEGVASGYLLVCSDVFGAGMFG